MNRFLFLLLAASLQYCFGTPPMCENERQEVRACKEFQMSTRERETFLDLMDTTGPNAEALVTYCPSLMNYLNCSKSFAAICHRMASYSTLSSVYDIVFELCDVQSRLHQAYIRNFDCVYELKSDVGLCEGSAQTQTSLYEQHYKSDSHGALNESQCLYEYLMLNCMAARITRSCGDEATETFWEIAIQGKQPCYGLDIDVVEAKYLAVLRGLDPPEDIDPPNMFHHRPVRH